MRRILLALALVTSPLLITLVLAVSISNAADRLQVILSAERPPSDRLPKSHCKNRDVIFKAQDETINGFLQDLALHRKYMSQLLFDRDDVLELETISFSLDQIDSALMEFEKTAGDRAVIEGPIGERKASYYRDLMKEIKEQDEAALSLNSTLLKVLCKQNKSPVTLLYEFWKKESIRRHRAAEYFTVVNWYVREHVKHVSKDQESLVSVVLTPLAHIAAVDTKALTSFYDKELGGNTRSYRDINKWISEYAAGVATVSGEMYSDNSKEMLREPKRINTRFIKRHRWGILTYYNFSPASESPRDTFLHELGHYMGLSHVFGRDSAYQMNDKCSGLIKGDSFIATMHAARSTDDKSALCECSFLKDQGPGGEMQFEDFDGRQSMVFDTSLALQRYKAISDINNPIEYFETSCKDSTKYRQHFDRDSRGAKFNFMTYRRGKYLWFSEGQKRTAKAMLSTFK